MLTTKKINNEKIKVIPVVNTKPDEILGYSIFPMLYCNIFICAQKGSGKTNIINKIMDSCINKETKVIVFASTHDIDENWKWIKKNLEKREINANYFSSLVENNIDNLEQIMLFMKEEATAENAPEEKKNINNYVEIIKFGNEKKIKLKLKKQKKKAPKYLIIFDDMSISLKMKNVPFLLKTFRHYKSKVIISSQYFNDITPDTRLQIDYWLLFKGQTAKKIEDIFLDTGCDISEELFIKLYKQITNEKYQFLYIDKNNCIFRKNFNEEVKIKS